MFVKSIFGPLLLSLGEDRLLWPLPVRTSPMPTGSVVEYHDIMRFAVYTQSGTRKEIAEPLHPNLEETFVGLKL